MARVRPALWRGQRARSASARAATSSASTSTAAAGPAVRACQTAMEMSPPNYLPDLPTETEPSYMPVWHSFETRAWEIGENIRAALKADRSLRRNDSVLRALADVIDCTTLRRGRQSFFFSLEYVSARKYAPRVAAYLSDKDVRGHALSALLKMRAAGYAAAVWFLRKRRCAGRFRN